MHRTFPYRSRSSGYRRVEMTGPASPAKMVINALNSGAKVWLADLEDASAPTWHNVIDTQLNLFDAARGQLSYTSPEGKEYALRTDVPLAVVVARPRGCGMTCSSSPRTMSGYP